MARGAVSAALAVALLTSAIPQAQAQSLRPELSGVGFLVGHWTAPTRGEVQDTGGSSLGTTSFTREVGGAVLLRKDHVSLFDKSGAPAGGFDIIMMIYPEGGTLHADYSDGTHIIHYVSAAIVPGRAVTFASATSPSSPTFRLTYTLIAPKRLGIDFSMAAPGSGDFHPVARGEAVRDD
jgi:hypothetical protein